MLLENYSNASMFNHNWLYTLILLIAIQSVIATAKNVFLFLHIEKIYENTLLFTALSMLGFICWLVLKALQSPQLFRGIDSNLQLVRTHVNISNPVEPNTDQSSGKRDAENQKKIDLLESDVLHSFLEDGSKISVRPSGTEPKIKFYFSVNTKLESVDKYEETERLLDQRIADIIKDMKLQ